MSMMLRSCFYFSATASSCCSDLAHIYVYKGHKPHNLQESRSTLLERGFSGFLRRGFTNTVRQSANESSDHSFCAGRGSFQNSPSFFWPQWHHSVCSSARGWSNIHHICIKTAPLPGLPHIIFTQYDRFLTLSFFFHHHASRISSIRGSLRNGWGNVLRLSTLPPWSTQNSYAGWVQTYFEPSRRDRDL